MRSGALLARTGYPDYSLLREWEHWEFQERAAVARAQDGQRPSAVPCHSHKGRPQLLQLAA